MIKTQNLSKELSRKPTLILLIFDYFGKMFDFLPNLEFSEAYFWIFKLWETDKLQKVFFSSGRKMHVTNVDYNSHL